MKILMMTNTYLPHVGGVARSIAQFSEQFRSRGHHVKIVAPEFDHMAKEDPDVIRIPAIRNFNHTDFSVIKPVPHPLTEALQGFSPDIVHSHHPFLMGNIALRVAHNLEVPLVFTHHTKYEDYTHNLNFDGEAVKKFAIHLATRYANLCDQIIAPSESMKAILEERGVTSPIEAVSTGVSEEFFGVDNDKNFRSELGIPQDAFVVGHLGRITKEKNVNTLVSSAIEFIRRQRAQEKTTGKRICFAMFGDGPELKTVKKLFKEAGLNDAFYSKGMLERSEVPKAYRTMDVFLFSSLSETQGMVITEAMASAKPVVAIDAPGVRDVVRDQVNGRLIEENDADLLAQALEKVTELDAHEFLSMRKQALATAREFTMENSFDKILKIYTRQIQQSSPIRPDQYDLWTRVLHTVESEWQIISNTMAAATESLVD